MVRYEDIKAQPLTLVEHVLNEIWPEKVEYGKLHTTGVNINSCTYKPRKATIGPISDRFSAKQIAYCYDTARDLIRRFGYDINAHNSSSFNPPLIVSSEYRGTPCDIHVNNDDSISLRSPDSIFGRGMSLFRRQITQNDTQALPLAN